MNAAVKNAIDYLHWEWVHKPYGLVCYGGASMGLRAATAVKPVLDQLQMTWCGDVSIPLMTTPVVDGIFQANDILASASTNVLNELATFTPLLKQLQPD